MKSPVRPCALQRGLLEWSSVWRAETPLSNALPLSAPPRRIVPSRRETIRGRPYGAPAYTCGKAEHMAKHIFVTGGVVSSLGKGITAASLGHLLKERG